MRDRKDTHLGAQAVRARSGRRQSTRYKELQTQRALLVEACESAYEYLSTLAEMSVEIATLLPGRALGAAFIDGLEIAGSNCEAALRAAGHDPSLRRNHSRTRRGKGGGHEPRSPRPPSRLLAGRWIGRVGEKV
jgi:hypothetical protein